MDNKLRIAGVVVIYNSDESIINNIASYIHQIEKLFIVDNSELPNYTLVNLLKKIPSVIYISNAKNEGIAKALNQGANAAIEQGFDYLLTMDDDTSVPDNMVNEMVSFVERHKGIPIGILAPQSVPELVNDNYKSVFITITSGNLVNLKAFLDCGPFLDELFIDWVDHEYCMRLKRKGYEIIELSYLHIQHRLGNQKNKNILGFNISWTSHSPSRMYYKMRNTLYVMSKYALFVPFKIHLILMYELGKDLGKSLLLEDKRIERIKFMLRAIIDFKSNKMGKYR